jgi:hypothetical protein
MTIAFGSEPPPGGLTLWEALWQFSDRTLRATLDQELGSRALDPSLEGVRRALARGDRFVRALDELEHDVRQQLISGQLKAVAMVLGRLDAVWQEVPPPHWNVLSVKDWQKSIVQARAPGTPPHEERFPLMEVRVFQRSAYQQLLTIVAGKPLQTKHRRKKERKADRIVACFYATHESEKLKWKDRTEGARHVRNLFDGKGDDEHARRYVLEVLKDEFDLLFPDSPDGVSER